jgi:hypothetical protein
LDHERNFMEAAFGYFECLGAVIRDNSWMVVGCWLVSLVKVLI